MKILLAINSTDPVLVVDRALRWCARTGYELRLFIPKGEYTKYVETVNEVNYHYYVAVTYGQIVSKMTAREYAEQYGFDLILTVPEDLWSWRKGRQFKPEEIYQCAIAVGKARKQFSEHPKKRIHRFVNGSVMERV